MDISTATNVVNALQALAPAGITLSIHQDRVCFDGPTGTHSLDISVSSEARVIAHFDGYLLKAAPTAHAAVMAKLQPAPKAKAKAKTTKARKAPKHPLINAVRYREQDGDECCHCSKEIKAGSLGWTSDVHTAGFCTRTCLYELVRLSREGE